MFVRSFLTFLILLSLPGLAHAESYLAAEPMMQRKVSMDGTLREWPSGFVTLKDKSGQQTKHSALVGYDQNFLYLGAKLDDSKIVRTKAGSQGEDRLVLDLYFPGVNRAGSSHQIAVYPGDPGKLAALVLVDGKSAPGASAIEAPTSSGYTLEAKIPWSSLPPAKSVRVGLRGKLSYFDASSIGRVSSIATSGSGSGSQMPPLTFGSETGIIQTILEPKNLPFTPAREVYGDLTGKGGVERVAIFGHFLSIAGPGYKGGEQFYFNEMDVTYAKQVTHLALVDFDGDGRGEIVLQKRLGTDDKYREVVQVLKLGADGAPLQIFMHEISIVTPEGNVTNKIEYSSEGKSARILIAQGSSKGFDPGSFREPLIGGGILSALLPWQTVKSRTFGWKGAGLTQLEETSWEPKVQASSATPALGPAVQAPPPPRPPTSDELLDRVYGLYKQDRGVKQGKKPSFDFVTDVVEDEQMERVLVHERDLVVFGKGFKKGLSYTYLTIGVKDPKDILSVTTRDLIGDGKAEILVHAVLEAQASESLGGDVVSRQALFVYKVIGESLTRIFAAETARSLKGNRIMSSVAFVPGPNGLLLELRPLRALGWTQKSYPFPEDKHPAGGLEPLQLPWTTVGPRRYAFNGSAYVLN